MGFNSLKSLSPSQSYLVDTDAGPQRLHFTVCSLFCADTVIFPDLIFHTEYRRNWLLSAAR